MKSGNINRPSYGVSLEAHRLVDVSVGNARIFDSTRGGDSNCSFGGATTLLALLDTHVHGKARSEIIAPIAAIKPAPVAKTVEIKSDSPPPQTPEPPVATVPREDTPVVNNTNPESTKDSAKIAEKYAVSSDAQME